MATEKKTISYLPDFGSSPRIDQEDIEEKVMEKCSVPSGNEKEKDLCFEEYAFNPADVKTIFI